MAALKTLKGEEILLDDDDFERFCAKNWIVGKHGYAYCGKVLLHRAILGLERGDGVHCDHRNRNRLDNRKENLRACTRAQNSCNRPPATRNLSGYKGVNWYRGKWQAKIQKDGKQKYLGRFDTAELASEFYDLAAEMLHGEFSYKAQK